MRKKTEAPAADPSRQCEEAIRHWYRHAIETGDWSTYQYWKGYLQGARDQKAWEEKQEEQTK